MKNFVVSFLTSVIVAMGLIIMNQTGCIPLDRIIRRYEIPDLIGLSKRDAEIVSRAKNVSLKIIGKAYSTEYPDGVVISQMPEAHPKSTSSQVEVILSKTSLIHLPNLKELSYDEAVEKLKELSLILKIKNHIYSGEIEKDKIIFSLPAFGEEVKKNDVINVTISKGQKLTTVPRITGKTFASARRVIKNRGLVVGTIRKIVDIERRFDIIIRQYPPAGRKVPKGASINITINAED